MTGCATRGDRVFRCRSGDGNARDHQALRDDPNIYILSVIARRLSPTQTGSAQPIAPVTVLDAAGRVQRSGGINICRERGTFSLSCRMP